MIVPEHVTYEALDDEVVILDLESGVYFRLNGVGSRIWQLLIDLDDEAAVREKLLAEYRTDAETLEADIARLKAELADRGLLR